MAVSDPVDSACLCLLIVPQREDKFERLTSTCTVEPVISTITVDTLETALNSTCSSVHLEEVSAYAGLNCVVSMQIRPGLSENSPGCLL